MKSKTIHYLIFALILFSNQICAQDEYAKWLKEQQSKYQNFLEEEDKKFAEFLLKNWKPFELKQDTTKTTQPKIPAAPVFEPLAKSEDKPEIIKSEKIEVPADVIIEPEIEQEKESPIPILPKENPKPEVTESETSENIELIEFDFYKEKNSIPAYSWLKTKCPTQLTKEAISNYWKEIASNNNSSFIQQINNYKNEKQLNDWGYLQYLYDLSHSIHPNDHNSQYLLIWFSLVKSGFEARIGISENKALLLIPTMNKLFGIPFLSDKERDLKFYVIDFENLENKSLKEISTYDGKYDSAVSYVDMNIRTEPLLIESKNSRTLKFKHRNKDYSIKIDYNRSLADYYQNYPYVNLDVYFNAALGVQTLNSLKKTLADELASKSEIEKVNFLLSFVQKLFNIKPMRRILEPKNRCLRRRSFFMISPIVRIDQFFFQIWLSICWG
jgi:hypothetical protein